MNISTLASVNRTHNKMDQLINCNLETLKKMFQDHDHTSAELQYAYIFSPNHKGPECIERMKFLNEKVLNNQARNNEAARTAAVNANSEALKFLLKCGISEHTKIDCVHCLCQYQKLELVEELLPVLKPLEIFSVFDMVDNFNDKRIIVFLMKQLQLADRRYKFIMDLGESENIEGLIDVLQSEINVYFQNRALFRYFSEKKQENALNLLLDWEAYKYPTETSTVIERLTRSEKNYGLFDILQIPKSKELESLLLFSSSGELTEDVQRFISIFASNIDLSQEKKFARYQPIMEKFLADLKKELHNIFPRDVCNITIYYL